MDKIEKYQELIVELLKKYHLPYAQRQNKEDYPEELLLIDKENKHFQ